MVKIMLIRKKIQNILHPIVIFVAVQLVWLTLVGLWIYFYISNHIIMLKVGNQLAPQLRPGSYHILVLIFGIILLVLLQGGFYFIFIYLNRQINLNRMHDQFLANITHELKSPLASIQLYLETLVARQVPREKQAEFYRLMMNDTNRLRGMIDKIVGTIFIDSRRLAFNFKVYNMRTIIPRIVDEVLVKYSPEIKEHIHIENRIACRCVLDKNSFKIIFINLIDNSIKYSYNGFILRIRMRNDDKYFILEVEDGGIGIPPKEQKRVFRKFYRVYGHEIPNVKGTGLGLYIVKEVIKYHAGKIKAESAGKNKGTTIRIELPIYKKTKKHLTNRMLKHTIKRKKRSELEQ